jgi:AraC-like DNA-binding protein
MATPIQGVVPVTYVQLLYDYLGAQGIDAEDLLGPAPVAEQGIGRFPVQQWQLLLERSAQALDDPLLGLHVGETISPKHLGVLGYVLLACGTLGAALQRLERYHQLIYDVNPMQLEMSGDQLQLVWGQEMGRPGALVDETAVAALIHFCRDVTDRPDYAPISVSFINDPPSDIAAYQAWFGCEVLFGQAETRVAVRAQALQTPLRSADPALIDILQKQADELLRSLPQADSHNVSNTVRQQLTQQMRDGEPSAEATAAAMHITSRTLHRRLANEGTNFRLLLQQTRHQLAQQYLQDSRLQLVEVAQLLGYSEQSALSRAFKDWSGQTPAQYRRQATH